MRAVSCLGVVSVAILAAFAAHAQVIEFESNGLK
jgi:hypothetical protein